MFRYSYFQLYFNWCVWNFVQYTENWAMWICRPVKNNKVSLWITLYQEQSVVVDYFISRTKCRCGLLYIKNKVSLWITLYQEQSVVVDYFISRTKCHCGLLYIKNKVSLWITLYQEQSVVVDYFISRTKCHCGLLYINKSCRWWRFEITKKWLCHRRWLRVWYSCRDSCRDRDSCRERYSYRGRAHCQMTKTGVYEYSGHGRWKQEPRFVLIITLIKVFILSMFKNILSNYKIVTILLNLLPHLNLLFFMF